MQAWRYSTITLIMRDENSSVFRIRDPSSPTKAVSQACVGLAWNWCPAARWFMVMG